MLNYIWSGLIIASLLFALSVDVQEMTENRFRNDQPMPLTLEFPEGYAPDARRQPVRIRIDSAKYQSFFGVDSSPEASYSGALVQTQEGRKRDARSNSRPRRPSPSPSLPFERFTPAKTTNRSGAPSRRPPPRQPGPAASRRRSSSSPSASEN